MPTVPVYNMQGEKVGEHPLSDAVFGVAVKSHVVASVVEALRANERRATAHTKHRGEVRGGGKKPWRQKGTGRARVGSIRSPLWRGGGIIFGPRSDQNFSKKINAKMRTDAIRMVLSDRVRDGNLALVDTLTVPDGKTKALSTILGSLARASGCAMLRKPTLLLLDTAHAPLARAARNLATVSARSIDAVSALELLRHHYLLATTSGIAALEQRFMKR